MADETSAKTKWRCETCKYWERHTPLSEFQQEYQGKIYGQRQPDPVDGWCNLEGDTLDGVAAKFWVTTNDDPTGVALSTEPDFGCVQWVRKEEKADA